MDRRALVGLVSLLALLVGAMWFVLAPGELPSKASSPPLASASSTQEEARLVAPLQESARSDEPRVEVRDLAPELPESAATETDAFLEVLLIAKEDEHALPGTEIVVVASESSGWRGRHVQGNTGGPEQIVRTDESGKAQFRLAPGGYRVHTASFDGDVEQTSVEVPFLVAGSRESIVFPVRTRPDHTVFGLVVDGETDVPIAGASVRVLDQDEVIEALGARVDSPVAGSTSPTGVFELDAATWKETYARIDAPGYAFAVAGLKSLSFSSHEPSRILMHKGAVLLVNVEHAGVWRAGLTVRAEADGNQLLQLCDGRMFVGGRFRMVRELQTDAHGSCRFDGLPPGVPLKVEVFDGKALVKRVPEDPVLQPDSLTRVEVRIGTGCRIEGLAVNQQGEPAARLRLWLIRAGEAEGTSETSSRVFESYDEDEVAQKAWTDRRGRFVLEDVAPGTWWVGPRPSEGSLDPPTTSAVSPMASLVTIAEGEASRELTLTVYQGLFIRGRVLLPDELRDQESGQVFASSENADFDGSFDAESGSFVLGPLVPAEYQVFAYSGFRSSEAVLAHPGDEDVVLRIHPGGILSGRVVGEDGERLEGFVRAVSRIDLQGLEGLGFIDSQGTFEIEGVAAGIYDVLVETERGRVGFLRGVTVVEGSACADLRIVLEAACTLQVRAEDGEVGIFAYQGDELVGVGFAEGTSTSRLRLPAGECLLRYGSFKLAPNGWTGSLRLDLSPGEEREIVLPKQP
jgi:hypothetical protein